MRPRVESPPNIDQEVSDDSRIKVFARLRPTFSRDRDEPGFEEIVRLERKNVSLVGGKTYLFDGTFPPNAAQESIWIAAGRPVVDNLFKGYSGTCLCYGQTGTGKSYTMSNMGRGEEGVIMQSMMYMFQRRQTDEEWDHDIRFSYLQLYRDRVGDLMKPESDNLDVVKSDSGEVLIPGLTDYSCNSRERFIELYEDGDSNRVVAATKMNPVSSRGHACLMLSVQSTKKGDDGTGERRSAKMWMIDLAGYERFSKTGVLDGIRKEEARHINASLLSLGNVISALSDKSPHIPWRNSKLTRLLQDAVGGKAKCTVILTLGPSGTCFHETVGTLYFGCRAMAIKTEAKVSLSTDYVALCRKLEVMLTEERQKYSDMELQFTRRQFEAQEREERMKRELAKIKARHDAEYARLIQNGADPRALEKLIRENEAELELVQEQQQEEILIMEDDHDQEVQRLVARQAGVSREELDKMKKSHDRVLSDVRLQLQHQTERLKEKEKECESLHHYISNLKEEHSLALIREREAAALGAGVSEQGVNSLKREYERQTQSIKVMMEATHAARMQEQQERHEGEQRRAKAQLNAVRQATETEYEQMKTCLIRKYETQLEQVREKSKDVQEKLKRNHHIIKNSYQEQKEKLKQELAELRAAGGHEAAEREVERLHEENRSLRLSCQEQIDRMRRKVRLLEQQFSPPELPSSFSFLQLDPLHIGWYAGVLGMRETDPVLRDANVKRWVQWLDARRSRPQNSHNPSWPPAPPPPAPEIDEFDLETDESPRAEARLRTASIGETPLDAMLRPGMRCFDSDEPILS
eukprot:Hpha_TRINITY_DN16649_c0_g5::TRINITY_DN16649_c0_g5_i1::g.182773::m.182773/K10396/KIF5; kinesin family member 5